MKNVFKYLGTYSLLYAVAVVAMIGLAGCPSDGGGNGGDDKPLFSVSGEFKGADRTSDALFKAQTTATKARSAISANTSYELTGELEDGDILFRLKGTYDSASGSYTVSAASSIVRYTINGNSDGSTATLAVYDTTKSEWKSFIVSVTVKEVSVKDGTAEDYAGGLPAWAQGSWYDWWLRSTGKDEGQESFEAWSYFNQWYYEAWKSSVWYGNWDFTSIKYTVIEAEPVSGQDGVYDVIFSYPIYSATDAHKKAALQKFFQDNNHQATFWNKKFDPWDQNAWVEYENDVPKPDGKNWNNSVIWYICMNPAHENSYRGPKIINWDESVALLAQKNLTMDDDIYGDDAPWWVKDDATWKERKEALEAFFAEEEISNWYYWGWYEDDWYKEDGWDHEAKHESRAYTCWEPSCEDGGMGGWWQKTHYYVKGEWGNQTGIQGDWDTYRSLFEKWNGDDYLITYLRGLPTPVQPTTWYTRARIWMEDDTFMFFYYNGDKEAENSHSHYAPACDTTSLEKIKSLTFDPKYYDWSFLWQRNKGATPRGDYEPKE